MVMPMDEGRCPDEVIAAVLEILTRAILAIRAAGWSGAAEYCAIEADHVHNLPALIRRYRVDQLEVYLAVERPEYLEKLGRIPGANTGMYVPLWDTLERVLASEKNTR